MKNPPRRFCKDSKFFTLTSNPGAMSFLGQDVVYHSVFQCLPGGHPVVAVHVGEDLVERLPGAFGDNLAELGARLLNLLGGNEDVRSLALSPAQRLVDQDAGVGERRTLALLAGTEQDCTHRGGHAGADGPDRRGDELHGVIDGEAARNLAARCVQVEGDVRLAVQRRQEEQLGLDDVRDIVVDGHAQEDDAVHEQAAEDVHGGHVHLPLFDDGRVDIAVNGCVVAPEGHRADAPVQRGESLKFVCHVSLFSYLYCRTIVFLHLFCKKPDIYSRGILASKTPLEAPCTGCHSINLGNVRHGKG